jgi:hypothetical protein
MIDSFAATERTIHRGEPCPPLIDASTFRAHRAEWSMFFAAVYSLQEHPGMNRENARPKSISECAKIADEMLLQLDLRLRNGL